MFAVLHFTQEISFFIDCLVRPQLKILGNRFSSLYGVLAGFAQLEYFAKWGFESMQVRWNAESP